MHFPLGVFLFSPFFRWIGKRKRVWRPRKRLRAFHEAIQKRECTFPRLLQPGRGCTEPAQPGGSWERWRDLLWLQKGHVCEWQMSLPEGGCVHVLWVCIGPFLKSLVVSFCFFFFLFFLQICHLYGKIEMSFLCLWNALWNAICSWNLKKFKPHGVGKTFSILRQVTWDQSISLQVVFFLFFFSCPLISVLLRLLLLPCLPPPCERGAGSQMWPYFALGKATKHL